MTADISPERLDAIVIGNNLVLLLNNLRVFAFCSYVSIFIIRHSYLHKITIFNFASRLLWRKKRTNVKHLGNYFSKRKMRLKS